jgi:hypothetical protein
MEDQRERVADASFAFVRRHHLRWLALSLVELAPNIICHRSISLLRGRERKTEDGSTSLKWTQTATKGRSAASTLDGSFARNADKGSFARANADQRVAPSNADKDPRVWLSSIDRTF